MAYCNNKFVNQISKILNPTIHFHIGYFNILPYAKLAWNSTLESIATECKNISICDWDSYENSWNFSSHKLASKIVKVSTLREHYPLIRRQQIDLTNKMQELEQTNNSIFIELYGLQSELTKDVPLSEITLTCNPRYRYGEDKSDEELESHAQRDTIKELLSYAIGCMMGRYSLDEFGLIYAHSGNQGFDQGRYKTFPADDDGIVPAMDGDWFSDDATNRIVEFLKVTWSPETLEENLKFVADSLDPKSGELPLETIRRFISSKFFKDHHLKVYKKRPIYWLYSSGKHKAFECLVYLHRYNESTLSRMRSAYVTPLQGKFAARLEYLENEIRAASSTAASRQFQKELDTLKKKQLELREFDDLLRHYADQKITLDLDDGVKVNYGKFGNLLAEVKAITGESSD